MSSFSNPNDKDHRDPPLERSPASSDLIQEDDDSLILAEEEDTLVLAEESQDSPAAAVVNYALEDQSPFVNPMTAKMWKILIADDEKAIHEVTQLALQGFTFHERPLTFLSAYSGQEAKEILTHHSDIALILLDVVMETNNSGLEVTKYIRETLKNKLVRIILRTGQPGEAPEESIIVNYDINDYKLKTELTQRKLFTTLVAGLRGYYDLMTLEANKRFSKQILESVPVGVTVYNADGSMHYANKQASHLLGKGIVPNAHTDDLTEVYQLYLAGTQLLYPRDRLPMVLALQGRTVCADDLEIHQPTRIIPVETWSTPVYDEHNQITQAIVAFQDITERKQAEANKICLVQEQEAKNAALRYSHEIKVKNTELIQLNQEKNEFLSIVAHDLKNPLSAILGLADMIATDLDRLAWEDIVECTKGITISANQMFNLISNLLDVNRIESGKLEPHLEPANLMSTIHPLVKTYQEQARNKRITLHIQAFETYYGVLVDQNLAHQVFDNLLSNAIKYSPHGKSVYVNLLQTEQEVQCAIQDEGPGLSPSDQRKLFGKFARLTPKPTDAEHSTGLGLFIVKKLVTAMKGRVECKSELGKGSRFTVTFPKLD